jgi:hypothetical protein
MQRKITRIFLRGSAWLLLGIFLLLVIAYFSVQSYAFQTWLARKVSSYLSDDLHTEVSIGLVRLDFFSEATLTNVHVLDMHGDTLLHGDLHARISGFSLRHQKVNLDEIELTGLTAKVIRYRNDTAFNFQFLADYFSGGDSSSGSGWDVHFGKVRLNNVNFTYRREAFAGNTAPLMNYDDIRVTSVFGSLDGISISKDTFYVTSHGLMGHEQSGIELSRLDGHLRLSPVGLSCRQMFLKTASSVVKGDIVLEYSNWHDFTTDFINKVNISASIKDSSQVAFSDIAHFARELEGLDAIARVSGNVTGLVSDLHATGFLIAYGHDTRFRGNVTITGLPDISNSYLHFDAQELSTSYADIISLPQYPFRENKKLSVPLTLTRLGKVSYKGKFDGFTKDFTTYGRFTTALGSVGTRLSVRTGEKPKDILYEGQLNTNGFDLGTLLGQNDFNGLVFRGEVKGRGLDLNAIDAELHGVVDNLSYNNYNYRYITVDGSIKDRVFNGLLTCKDPNADFDFNGSINFQGKVPEMDFISTINHLRLRQLHFTTKADSGTLSSQILINIRGDNIDNLTGQIHFDNTIYTTRTRQYKLSTLNLQADQEGESKKINLSSAYLNAFVHGRFSLSRLRGAFDQFAYSYYPTLYKKKPASKRYTDELEFRVVVKNFTALSELFIPELKLSPSTLIEGNFNADQNRLNMQMTSSRASYKSVKAEDLIVIVNESGRTVLAEVSGRALHFSDSLSTENFNLTVKSEDTDTRYTADWNNLRQPINRGEISGALHFGDEGFTIRNEKTNITLNDSVWIQSAPAKLHVSRDGSVEVDSLFLSSHHQNISAKGRISKSPADSLIVGVHNVVLEQFNPLLKLFLLKVEGVMNGDLTLSNGNGNFVFSGDLDLSRFKINENLVGGLNVNTRYHATEKRIDLNGFTSLGIADEFGNQAKNIAFSGSYFPARDSESIDITFSTAPANLKLLNPYLTGILTIQNGFVNGSGKVTGTPSNFRLDGKFRLFNSEIKVDYTNVSYMVTGDIELMPDQIRFSDMLLREKGSRSAPQGTLNGNIFHRNFERMRIDYDVTYQNMLVLNTTERENSTFYGRIYGTGKAGIYGYLNDLHMEIRDITTARNSRFVLPLDGPAEIGENDFIHFVKKDTVKTRKNKPLTGFSLDMIIHATPDAQAQIILDKQTGDMLTAQGYGDLSLRINTLGNFEMFGDYMITNGDYVFTLENVINRKFDIESGSSISWSGNPYNAEIDVTASYKLRASIAPLLGDTTAKGRFPVECKVLMTDKLFSPTIRFAIEFPNIDATARARINNVLSDETELNNQVATLLLFKTFVTPRIYNTGGGVTAGGAAASTASDLMSNQMSEFLNTYFGSLTGIQDLQLGLNYRPGNRQNSESVDLALSKQFFNNKVSFDGNFGVNNNQYRNSSGLIGDVNIDYKLSDDGRFRLKGFNRSNDISQITTTGAPYTQGIGLFYREEFETFGQLIKRYQRRQKRMPKVTPDNAAVRPSTTAQPEPAQR